MLIGADAAYSRLLRELLVGQLTARAESRRPAPAPVPEGGAGMRNVMAALLPVVLAEIDDLKRQMEEMQKRLNRLGGKE